MSNRVPCVLIGWDGATFDLLLPWMEQGLLPNLTRLREQGTARVLRSVIPPISPAAWVTIFTGQNPGRHGILDFSEFDARHYVPQQRTLINSTHFSGTTIFDQLSKLGMKVCSLQMPLTYPVWPVNGLLLAGVPNPDDSQAFTYPPGRDFGPLRAHKTRRNLSYDKLLENCTFHIRKITDIFCQVAAEDFDLMAVYFHESDDFHHRFWRQLDASHPAFDAAERKRNGNPILRIYQELDESLGRLLAARPDANFFLISDHGGASVARRRLFLNRWLERRGYLKLRTSLRGTLERNAYQLLRKIKPLIPRQIRTNIANEQVRVARTVLSWRNNVNAVNWSETQAFAVHLNSPACGVEINLQGREGKGCVAPDDYDNLCRRLLAELREITDPSTGQKVVREAYHRKELFEGPNLERIPDLLLVLDTDVMVRTEMNRDEWGETSVSEYRDLSGDHSMEGIMVAQGPSLASNPFLQSATIMDVAPTLLYAMKQAVPEEMDGRALEDLFTPEFLAENPLRQGSADVVELQHGSNVYSKEEEEAIRERLGALGYLGE